MKIESIAVTTKVDRHGDQFSLESLNEMCEQTKQNIIPMGYEHDPRIAPVGRYFDAEVLPMDEEEEFQLKIIGEIFDGDTITDVGDKEIETHLNGCDSLGIIFDRNFENESDISLIKELKEIIKSDIPLQQEIKKSLEPISVLTILGGFVVTQIASGFVSKIGCDLYDKFIEKLSKLSTLKKEEKEKLLVFNFTIYNADNKAINTEIILTNPTSEDIDNVIKIQFKQLEQIMPNIFNIESSNNISKVVFEYKDGELEEKYVLTKQGLPATIKWQKQD